MLLEKTLESPLDCKKIQPVHPKWDQPWVFIGRTDVEAETPILLDTWCEALTHWKRPWCWERLRAGGEADDRGWDGWMASSTQWTWVWVDSRSWWWTERPGVLQFLVSKRVGHDWGTELNWTEWFNTGSSSLLPGTGLFLQVTEISPLPWPSPVFSCPSDLPLPSVFIIAPSSFTDIIASCLWQCPLCLFLLFTLQNHLSSSLVKIGIIQWHLPVFAACLIHDLCTPFHLPKTHRNFPALQKSFLSLC